MIKNVGIFVALVVLLISVICIFNTRWIAKNKFKSKNQNMVVDIIRVISYIICVFSLLIIYYLK